jgi:hypothetical protein
MSKPRTASVSREQNFRAHTTRDSRIIELLAMVDGVDKDNNSIESFHARLPKGCRRRNRNITM